MQIKRFIVYALVYLVIVGALVYLFEGGSYELHLKFSFLGSDTAYALNLPVAVWMILPPAILTLFCVLHMAYHGFKFYAFKRKISHDEKFYRELGKEILLGLDTNKDFKTDFYKIPSQMARILSPWDRYKDASIEGEELQSVLDIMRTVKNGEIADLKKFKLPKDNPLFIKNELNKIAHLDGYYLETLKKSADEQGEIAREARRKLINLGSFADIRKFAPDLDEKEIMTLIARFAKDEINLSNDEILELLNSDKISKDSFGIGAATLKSKIAPDAVIGIFERLKNERQEAQEAYVYLLFEFEMLERAQEVLSGLEAGEYQNFRTLLYLRQNGKNVPTDLFFKHAHC